MNKPDAIRFKTPPLSLVRWRRAYRIISSRYPPIHVFERIAPKEDWDALYEIEALTNPRVRQEWGDISRVPVDERPEGGPGVSWLMAAFTHIGRPSRFSDGSYGVYYAARELRTSVRETAFHFGAFLRATREPLGTVLEMRALISESLHARFHDLRKAVSSHETAAWLDPRNYAAAQSFAKALRKQGAHGIVYPSVRQHGGECLAVFRPKAISPPLQGPHLRYHFDGENIDRYITIGEETWTEL